jgi:hypothetical protein
LFLFSDAQDNKPEANSFGMQYGVNFNGTVSQAVQLSGWIKKGIEIRGAMTFSYSNAQSNTVNGNSTVYSNGREIPAIYTSQGSSASLTTTPTISVVKHFPTKNNLDFYLGGSANCGFTAPTASSINWHSTTADSFYSYTNTTSKGPMTLNWGLSLIGGANFFFYKNLAIGADFGIGFNASNSNGNYQEHDVVINNGLNNQNKTNYDKSFTNKTTNSRYSLALTGNAGLHLTYYLKVNKHKTATAKI